MPSLLHTEHTFKQTNKNHLKNHLLRLLFVSFSSRFLASLILQTIMPQLWMKYLPSNTQLSARSKNSATDLTDRQPF